MRKAGYPTSGVELNNWRASVSEPENGALQLVQAFDLERNLSGISSNFSIVPLTIGRTNELSPSARIIVDEYVQANRVALSEARAAVRSSAFRYPVDFSYGPDTQLPHLGKAKEMARILAFRAALAVEGGRSNEWPQDILLQLKLAQTLDNEPTVISHLVRDSMLVIAARAAEWSLNRGGTSKELCEALQNAFRSASSTNLLPMVLVGERALTIPTFRMSWKEMRTMNTEEGGEPRPHQPQQYSGKPAPALWLSGFLERDLNFFLETMQKAIALAAMPFPQSLTLTNYLECSSKVAEHRLYLLSSMLLPSLSRIIVRDASSRTVAELAATAMAIERFRCERGQLPANLAELTPQFLDRVGMDPFDGVPLRYKLLPKGYVIYSVDVDGRDDGGHEPPERRKSTDPSSYDLTFVVER